MDWLRLSLVIPLGADVIDKALDLRANDFEDALQYFSAVQAHADCLGAQGVRNDVFINGGRVRSVYLEKARIMSMDFLTGKRVLWYQVIIQKSESRATVICAIFGSFSHSYGAMSRSIRIFARK